LLSVRVGLAAKGTSPEGKKLKYPAVEALVKDGWKLGF